MPYVKRVKNNFRSIMPVILDVLDRLSRIEITL